MEILNNPFVVALVTGIPSFILGMLLYRRSVKVDKATEQAMVISARTAGIEQVISGLNLLNDNLQDDNRELRMVISECGIKLQKVVNERDAVLEELHNLQRTMRDC